MKKFICKFFGHKTIDEVYAVRMYGRKPLYVVVNETKCERCGEIIRRSKSKRKWLDFYHHENRLRKWWEGIDECQNHAKVKEINFQCRCTYVHELQHALRLCGLNDTSDNFKI